MADRIKIPRGLKANLPTLDDGELAYCTDTEEFFIGTTSGNVLLQPVDAEQTATVLISDNFDRADSTTAVGTATTGQTWQVKVPTGSTATYGITSNTVYLSSADVSGNKALIFIDSGQADITVQAKFHNVLRGSIVLRCKTTDEPVDFIRVRHDHVTFTYVLEHYISGNTTSTTTTEIARGTTTSVAGDIVKVVADGSSYQVFLNGNLEMSGTYSANLTETLVGWTAGGDWAQRMDDFEVTTLGTVTGGGGGGGGTQPDNLVMKTWVGGSE